MRYSFCLFCQRLTPRFRRTPNRRRRRPRNQAAESRKTQPDADEEDPAPTADGDTLLYASKTKGSYDIYKSTKSAPARSTGQALHLRRRRRRAKPVQVQGQVLFATNEIPDEKFAKEKNFDLKWQAGFQAPRLCRRRCQQQGRRVYPWVTPAGKEFYFSRRPTRAGCNSSPPAHPWPDRKRSSRLPAGFHPPQSCPAV